MRRSGRTTRMMEQAEKEAKAGKAVYVIFANAALAAMYKTPEREALGIKFETPSSLPNFNWRRWTNPGANENCVFLADHFTIENHWCTVLEMAHRWDSTTTFAEGDFVRKEGGDFSFEGHVVSVVRKKRSGEIRYVVEDDRGLLFIFRGEQLTYAGRGNVRASEA